MGTKTNQKFDADSVKVVLEYLENRVKNLGDYLEDSPSYIEIIQSIKTWANSDDEVWDRSELNHFYSKFLKRREKDQKSDFYSSIPRIIIHNLIRYCGYDPRPVARLKVALEHVRLNEITRDIEKECPEILVGVLPIKIKDKPKFNVDAVKLAVEHLENRLKNPDVNLQGKDSYIEMIGNIKTWLNSDNKYWNRRELHDSYVKFRQLRIGDRTRFLSNITGFILHNLVQYCAHEPHDDTIINDVLKYTECTVPNNTVQTGKKPDIYSGAWTSQETYANLVSRKGVPVIIKDVPVWEEPVKQPDNDVSEKKRPQITIVLSKPEFEPISGLRPIIIYECGNGQIELTKVRLEKYLVEIGLYHKYTRPFAIRYYYDDLKMVQADCIKMLEVVFGEGSVVRVLGETENK